MLTYLSRLISYQALLIFFHFTSHPGDNRLTQLPESSGEYLFLQNLALNHINNTSEEWCFEGIISFNSSFPRSIAWKSIEYTGKAYTADNRMTRMLDTQCLSFWCEMWIYYSLILYIWSVKCRKKERSFFHIIFTVSL